MTDEMITQQELEELREQYMQEVSMAEALEEEADMADTEYSTALSDWEKQDDIAPIVKRRNLALAAYEAQVDKRDRTRDIARQRLEAYFLQTGIKLPFGADDETMLVQERLDWDVDDSELASHMMLRGLVELMSREGLSVRKGNKKAELTKEMMTEVIQFMRLFLKIELAKGDFRKWVSANTSKVTTQDGDVYVEIPEEWEDLPIEFKFKTVPVIGDKKLLAWYANRNS